MARFGRIGACLVAAATLSVGLGTAYGEGFPSEHVTLLEHIDLGGFPTNPTSGNDCWGYVSPSGREYALVGLRNAVAVVELSDPAGPVIVESIAHQSSNWCDIRTYGTYAYAVNESGGGLDVIDLSLVDEGVVTLVQRVTDDGLSTCHNIAVNETSGFLYLCASNINGGRFVAMSLADPADPVIAGNFPIAIGGVVHDAQVVTYDRGPYAGREIAFCASGTDGIEIYDVTDKAAMFELAEATYPNEVYTHQCWPSDDLQYLYVNDELDQINETVIFDISDPARPLFAGTYSSGVEATDHNVFYHDGFIYEAEYRAGIRVFDATDPLHPVQVGWLDTFPGDDSGGSGGVWGVYPFLPSGKVVVSDKNRGLFVVWPHDPPLVFDAPGGVPDTIDPAGDSFVVAIDAVDGHTLDPTSARLVYATGAGAIETPLALRGDGNFDATFDAIACGTLVQFHLRAATTDGIAIRWPAEAPCEAFFAIAAASSSVILADDFESGSTWEAGAPGDTASLGVWTRVDPVGTAAQPENDHTPGTGRLCFVTGQGEPNGQIGANDVDDGSTTLTSPRLDLSGATQVTIAYWRWYDNGFEQFDADEGQGPHEDVFTVEISGDDGATWTNVETVGPAGPETNGGWFLHAFDAGTLVDLTADVRVRFIARDDGNLSIVEAGVDDLLVRAVVCDPLPGDVDGDGVVGFADLLAVLSAWGPCPACPEDVNQDGTVGLPDLLIVLSNWTDG